MTDKTYPIEMPGIGVFTFRRRKMRDEFRVGAEYSRLTEGVESPSSWLDMFATAFSTLKVLTVESPAGWDMEEMEPDDPDSYRKIMEVFGALRADEARFRSGSGANSEAGRAGNGGHDPAVVPA
jgi:hypothetical protein